MRYKHHLTEQQYMTIWKTWVKEDVYNYTSAFKEDIIYRKYIWRTLFKQKFKLTYKEPFMLDDKDEPYITDDMRDKEDYWGTVTGSKKAINWFLLHL